jgi:UDP-glucose 4-epimerase
VHAEARGTAPDFSALSSPAYVDDGLDVCYVKDCARAIALLQLAPRLNHRTYNIASGKVLTNREAAAAIKGSSPTRGPSAQSPTTLPGSVKATTANRSPPTWGQRRRRPRNPADKAAAP